MAGRSAAADGLLVADEQQVLTTGAGWPGCSRWPAWPCWPAAGWPSRPGGSGCSRRSAARRAWSRPCCWPRTWSWRWLAAAAGLAIGWLAAPLLTSPGAGLVGAPGAPSLTLLDRRPGRGRGARGGAGRDARPRHPRRPHQHGQRAGGRGAPAAAPGHADRALGAAAGAAAARAAAGRPQAAPRRCSARPASRSRSPGSSPCCAFHATGRPAERGGLVDGLTNPVAEPGRAGAAGPHRRAGHPGGLNAIFTAWATVLDARHSSALARALGATRSRSPRG